MDLQSDVKALSHAVLQRNKQLNTGLTRQAECEAGVKSELPNGGRDLPHYCKPGVCWCSEKLSGRDYPAGCIRFKCEHHQGAQS